MDSKKNRIDMEELQYYFDAQERDTLDLQGRSRRSTEVLTIRDKLLALPQADFESAVKTIKNILHPGESEKAGDDPKARRRDATELYEKARADAAAGSAPLKVGSIRGS